MSSIITKIIKEGFINHVKNRLDKECSFFGFLLHNCPKDEKKIITRYIYFDFKKDSKIDSEVLPYNNSQISFDSFYDSLCQKKRTNPQTLLFIFEPNSDLYGIEDIRKNCYSVDIDACIKLFKKEI